MAELSPEEKKRLEEQQAAAAKPQPAAPAAQAQPKPQPLATPTPTQVQANLPGLTVGQQTRGAGAVRLDQQQAPAGKELIGMRSGVPIYADATDVYSNEASSIMSKSDAADKAARASVNPTLAQELGAMTAGPNKTAASTPAATFANASIAPSTEELRKAYQTGPTATAVRAQQAPEKKPGEPANAGGFFSKEYADQFTAAQAAANQRAKERIAYGGQLVRDTSNSMAVANNAAAAMRAEAARPELATKEDIETSGLDKATQQRLRFGVGENGESVSVTPDYLKNYMASKGITKRPGPNFNNPFSGASKPSNRLYRRPGL